MKSNELNILVIAPYYYWFIKEFTEAESRYVGKIDVLVHHNYLAEISNILPFSGYVEVVRQFFTKKHLIDNERKPNNVNVHLLSMFYLIPDGNNKRLVDTLTKKFESYIKKQVIEFNMIHAHFTYPQGYIAIKLGKKFGVPVIVTLHENMPHLNSLLKKHKKKVYEVWRNADALIRVNKKDFPIYLNAGVPESKLYHIPNGFNPEKFPVIPKDICRKQLNLDPSKKILLNVARLSEEKGQNYLIKAMKYVIQERTDVLCLIGGAGRLKEHLQKQITKQGLEEYVRLCGYIPDEKIAYFMNAADIFVLPSLSEGNPTVMFEALGVGLPFIGTTVGGIPEIITTEEYGMLVEPSDAKGLSEKILSALEKKWDNNSIMMYAKRYSWENIAKQTLRIYKTL